MIMNKVICFFKSITILILFGCIGTLTSCERRTFADTKGELSEESFDLYYPSEDTIVSMEASQDGRLSLLSYNGETTSFELVDYNNVKRKFELTEHYQNICYDEKSKTYYVYNPVKKQIIKKDENFEDVDILIDNFSPFEIKDMICVDNKLYMVEVDDNPYENPDNFEVYDDGYIDYNEKLIWINIESGEKIDLGFKNVITFCLSPDKSALLLYMHNTDSYTLKKYDFSSDKIMEEINCEKLGYIFSMAMIGDKLYFCGDERNGIFSYDFKSQEIVQEIPDIFVLKQCDFDTRNEFLIYLDRNTMSVNSFNTKTGAISNGESSSPTSGVNCDVVVGFIGKKALPFDFKLYMKESELKIGTRESETGYDFSYNYELLNELSDKNSDVDILILPTYFCSYLSEDGVCLPLESNTKLLDLNESYFNSISQYFRTDGNHVWGIPISVDSFVVGCIPENMKNNNLTLEMFSDFDNLIDSLEKIDEYEISNKYFIWGTEYGIELMNSYLGNTEEAEIPDEKLESILSEMWDDWEINSEGITANHPLMGLPEDGESLYEYSKTLSGDDLFKMMYERDLLCDSGFTDDVDVYPIPLITKEIRNNISVSYVVVLNPHSKKIDNSMIMLEELTDYLNNEGISGLLYADKTKYSKYYDTDSVMFKKMYEINLSSNILDSSEINYDRMVYDIIEYQNQKIDTDNLLMRMRDWKYEKSTK